MYNQLQTNDKYVIFLRLEIVNVIAKCLTETSNAGAPVFLFKHILRLCMPQSSFVVRSTPALQSVKFKRPFGVHLMHRSFFAISGRFCRTFLGFLVKKNATKSNERLTHDSVFGIPRY